MAHLVGSASSGLCAASGLRPVRSDRRLGVRMPFSGPQTVVRRAAAEAAKHSTESAALPQGLFSMSGPVLGVAAAILTALSPLEAQAVSGGGGDLQGAAFADLSGKDFSGKKYYKSDFKGTNFSNCNLERTNMFGSFAKGASFRGANMRLADLESVDFEGADLTDAILEGAQVANAQFKNVKIENTDWTDVILRKDVQKLLCEKASGTNPVTGVDTRESLLCR